MDATIAALWLARRLSNDAQTILGEFNQDRVDQVRAELRKRRNSHPPSPPLKRGGLTSAGALENRPAS